MLYKFHVYILFHLAPPHPEATRLPLRHQETPEAPRQGAAFEEAFGCVRHECAAYQARRTVPTTSKGPTLAAARPSACKLRCNNNARWQSVAYRCILIVARMPGARRRGSCGGIRRAAD